MQKYIPICLFFIIVTLTACAPDPRREATAFETRTRAEQAAANAEQARQFEQDQHNYDMAKEAWWLEVRKSTTETAKAVAKLTVGIAGVSLAVSLCVLILGTAWTANKTVKGMGEALVRAADVRANLIPIDKETRLFPAYLQYLGAGRFAGVNFNNQSVMILDTRNEPDRQMIANMGAVQVVGLIAREASKSSDPAGVSIIKAPTIDVTGEMVTLAKELMRRDDE